MAEAEGRPCPVCGEPISRNARRCRNCGSKIPRDDRGTPSPPSTDARKGETPEAPEGPPQEPRKAEPQGTSQSSVLYLCPKCGAFVEGSAETCGKCGTSLREEVAQPEESTLCPHCGSTIHVASEVCPSCGKSLGARSPALPKAPRTVSALLDTCAVCGAVLPPEETTCGICGTPRHTPKSGRLLEALTAPVSATPAEVNDVLDDLGLDLEATESPPKAPEPPRIAPEKEKELQRHLEELLTLVGPEPEVPAREESVPVARQPRAIRPATPEPAPTTPPDVPVAKPARPTVPTRVVRRAKPRVAPPIVPERTRPPSRFASLRDVAAVATAIVLLAAGASAVADLAGREWGQLLVFGVLFGIGAATTLPDVRPGVRRRASLMWFASGVALLVAAPSIGYAGVSDVLPAPLAVAGLALVVLAAWPLRRGIGVFLPWVAGLLLLTLLAVSPLAFVRAGSSGVEATLWAAGIAMALAPSTLVPYRRLLRARAEKELRRGDEAFGRKRYQVALDAYDRSIDFGRRAGRDLVEAWYGRGSALASLNRNEEALLALDRALALNPTNEVAWVNKGTALVKMNRIPDALRCYNSALRVNPSYEVAWNNKGNALARLGRHDRALECYERALSIDEDYRTAWVNKGFVLAKLGRFEEAASCADRARRLTAEMPAI